MSMNLMSMFSHSKQYNNNNNHTYTVKEYWYIKKSRAQMCAIA